MLANYKFQRIDMARRIQSYRIGGMIQQWLTQPGHALANLNSSLIPLSGTAWRHVNTRSRITGENRDWV
jgi:hypothetical protein